jgi:hypothetical protein
MGKYVYLTCCVDSAADAITEMKASAVAVTYATFRRHCDPFQCGQLTHYERDKRRGLTLRDDFTVGFFKATYKGVPAYYVDHSRIEYIWVREEDAKRLREQGEVDHYGRSKTTESVPGGRYYPSGLAGLDRGWLTQGGCDPVTGEQGRGDPGWAEPW